MNIDRETVMQIALSSSVNSMQYSLHGDAPISVSAGPCHPGDRANVTPRRTRAASPRNPILRASLSRRGSAAIEEKSSLDIAGTYDGDLPRMMVLLYEEREEKRRLLHLMRAAARTADPTKEDSTWTKKEAAGQEQDRSIAMEHTARSTGGRTLEHRTSKGHGDAQDFADPIKPETHVQHAERPCAGQAQENKKSTGFGFMLPFDVPFANVFQSRPENHNSLDPASVSWLLASPRPQSPPPRSSRRGLEFKDNAHTRPDASPQQRIPLPMDDWPRRQQPEQQSSRQQPEPPSIDHWPQRQLANHLPRELTPREVLDDLSTSTFLKIDGNVATSREHTPRELPISSQMMLEANECLEALKKELGVERQKVAFQDETIDKLTREREFLVKKCAELSIDMQQGALQDFKGGPVTDAQVADLQRQVESALARAAALAREVEQGRMERNEAVQAVQDARKERDKAIALQVNQQRMLVERSAHLEAALNVPVDAAIAFSAEKAMAAEVAALQGSLERFKQDLALATAALEESTTTAKAASSEAVELRKQLEEQHKVNEEVNRKLSLTAKSGDERVLALERSHKETEDSLREHLRDYTALKEANKKLALLNDELQSQLRGRTAELDERVKRAHNLEAQSKQMNDREQELKMELEEARNAVAMMFSAICKQLTSEPIGGVGLRLRLGKEPSWASKGKEGAEKAAAFHEELKSTLQQLQETREQLDTANQQLALTAKAGDERVMALEKVQNEMELLLETVRSKAEKQAWELDASQKELGKTREELKSTEGMQKELANTSSRLAEFTEKASDLQAQLEEANRKLSMTAKSGDERVLALEASLKEREDSLREQKQMSEKQALDLDEALSALRAVYSAVCKEGPAPVLGGIGIALGTATVSVKGKQKKLVQVTQLATSGPAAKAGVKVGDLLVEVDGRDVTNLDVKQVKEMTKGPPGSPMKLKAQRGGSVFEAVLERSGGTGTSMASVSDASSMLGNTSGVVGKELTASERGKEGMEAAVALHEELDRLRASLATMVGELDKTREELKSTEGMQKELANTSSRLAEFTEKASDLQAQLEEANRKLSVTAKSGDERVLALEASLKEREDSLREQKKMSEKQALDLDEALSALRAVHSAVCKEGPAPVLGGIGIALGTATVSVKGKQKKLVQVTQLATSGPAAKAGVKVGDLLVEVDGRDVTNLDVKQVKEMTKGPPGSPMKLKAQRGGSVFEAVLERSGGTGTSMASVSDASSMLGNTSGVVGKELTASERGEEGMEAAVALHEELDRLRASLATMVGELDKTREELKSTEGMQKELANTSSRLAEFTEKASDLQAQLEEANRKLSMTAKSGDERVLALEASLKEREDSLREQKKMSEKQALDLDEALSALRAVHSAVCKEGPAPVLGGIGIALGTATVSVKGKQKKLVQVTQLATSGPAAKAGVKVGDLLVEVDGRDVTNLDVKQVKEMTKGPPGSPMKLKAQRGGSVFEAVLERSGGTGTSMASVSDASSMLGNTSGVVGKELTASERGKEGMEAAVALHEELDRLRASLATMVGELDKTREELKSTEGMQKELANTSSRLAEFTEKASDLQAQLEEANRKLSMTAKSGDERVLALEASLKEREDSLREQKKMSEKQALDLDEALSALRAVHSAVCKEGPAPVLGGIGIALGTATVSVKGKQKKLVQVTQLATSGPAAKAGVKVGDLLVEVDGRDVTNLDVKQVKEMTKGPPGSPMKLKAQRGGSVFEAVLERSGGTGTSMASVSDASSMLGNTSGVVGKELTASERGKEGMEAAVALHEELDRLRASLATMVGELDKTREELKSTEGMQKELANTSSRLAEFTEKASDLQAQLEEANRKLSMTAKSGDERVLALEASLKEREDSLREQKKMSEKQALDLDEALSALRAVHSAVCKEGPAPVLGGIGIALGTATVSVKGKQKKLVQVTQLATSGPAAKAGVKVGDLLVEVDGRDVTNLDVKQVKELSKGPPGSTMKLRAQHSDSSLPYEVVLERSGGTGSDAGSLASGTTPGKSGGGATPSKSGDKEPSPFERGKAACDAANALLDEVNRLRRSLATASEELSKRSDAAASPPQTSTQQMPKPAQLTMTLGLDFSTIGTEGSEERESFKRNAAIELAAAASDLPSSSFHIRSVSRGSVILDVEITPELSGPEPSLIAADLEIQAGIPSSKLRSGKITGAVTDIAIFGSVRKAPLTVDTTRDKALVMNNTDKMGNVRRVELTVASARHLPKMDLMGSCDAFCKIDWAGFHGRTDVVSNTYSPDWDETFAFAFEDVAAGVSDLSVVVLDHNLMKSPKEVGRVMIPGETLKTFLQQQRTVIEEGSFAVLKEGDTVLGQDKQPCIVNLKMRLLGPGEKPAASAAVPSRKQSKLTPRGEGGGGAANPATPGTTGTEECPDPKSSPNKWEAVDKLSRDLAAAQLELAAHKSAKEAKSRQLSETAAALQALYSVLCRRESSGCTGGVGVAVVQEAVKEKGKVTRTFIKIGSIAPGGPAAKEVELADERGRAVLCVGDQLLVVDDKEVSGMDAKGVGQLLKGPVGTSVRIKGQKREGGALNTYEVTLKRVLPSYGSADYEDSEVSAPDSPRNQYPKSLEAVQKDTVLTKSVEAGKHGCEVAAALHAELDSLRAQLASTESALACRKDELISAASAAAAPAAPADAAHTKALVQQLTQDIEKERRAAAAAADSAAVQQQQLHALKLQLDALNLQMKEAKANSERETSQIKELLQAKRELECELSDCRKKQADQVLDLEEATTALKALHAAICSPKGQASAEGGIGVALGSETVNVKGKPVKMYKVAQLASSGPAAGSGAVQAGDYILEVDGRKLAGMLSKDVRALIRGPAGSAVKLRAQRPGTGGSGGPYEVCLVRGSAEADKSLASMSETASSVGGGAGMLGGATGVLAGREPSASERMTEGSDAALRLHEELDRLRAGGAGASAAAHSHAKEAAALAKELQFARSQLAQSEFRADALQRKVDESIAALEESAMLLEKREDDDAATLRKILGDNQALQLALRQAADQTAGNQQASANAHETALLREKNRRLEEELGLLRLRVHGAPTLTPHGATTLTPLAGSPPPKAGAAAKAGATGATTSDDARSQMSVELRSLRADDDAKSTRSMRSSFSEASEFSISDAAAAAAGSPEVCGVGMRLTNVAPHRVVSFLPNGPVGKCGAVEAGDLLVAIDGVETTAKQITEVRRLMTGAQGSTVELRFVGLRNGKKEMFAVSLSRQPPPKTAT